jgi:hypothetical protein
MVDLGVERHPSLVEVIGWARLYAKLVASVLVTHPGWDHEASDILTTNEFAFKAVSFAATFLSTYYTA